MSGREWKPGDVATFAGETVLFTDNGDWYWAATGMRCHRQGKVTSEARPLVVIDPGNREQVDALTKAIVEACYADGNVICANNGIHLDTVQAALREFADPKPPKCLASLNVRLEASFVAASCDEAKGHEGSHRSENGTCWDATEVAS